MMEEKNVDQEIKASMLKHTDTSISNKEEIWKQIETKLALHKENSNTKTEENNMNDQPRMNRKTPKLRKGKGWLTGTIAAVVLLGIFTTATDTGQAFVNNIKEYFAPQKQVVEEIEGMPEETEVSLQEGKAGYIIYIDEERYKLVEEDGIDQIVTKEPLDERYPEVSMTITQVADKAPAELAEEIYTKLKKSYETVKEITAVKDPVEGLLVSAIDGNQWNSPVTNVYLLSNEKEGSFIIQQKYFLEAAEGHGARFHHMLKEFKVVEADEE